MKARKRRVCVHVSVGWSCRPVQLELTTPIQCGVVSINTTKLFSTNYETNISRTRILNSEQAHTQQHRKTNRKQIRVAFLWVRQNAHPNLAHNEHKQARPTDNNNNIAQCGFSEYVETAYTQHHTGGNVVRRFPTLLYCCSHIRQMWTNFSESVLMNYGTKRTKISFSTKLLKNKLIIIWKRMHTCVCTHSTTERAEKFRLIIKMSLINHIGSAKVYMTKPLILLMFSFSRKFVEWVVYMHHPKIQLTETKQ